MVWYIPFITVMPNRVDMGMERVFLAATAMLFSTLASGIIIVVGAFLYPGPISPVDGRLRYISDGFEDYRILPLVCLILLAMQMGIFFWFAWEADRQTPRRNVLSLSRSSFLLTLVGVYCLASIAGMSMVAAVTRGVVHLMGAGIFIISYLIMHYALERLLVQTTLVTEEQAKPDEHFVAVGVIFFLLFGGLLAAGMAIGGDDDNTTSTTARDFKSASAVSEYLVFLAFLTLNLMGMHMMTRIGVEHEEVTWADGSERTEWMRRPGSTVKYARVPLPNPPPPWPKGDARAVVLRIPSTWVA
jgi:hypothetical protein